MGNSQPPMPVLILIKTFPVMRLPPSLANDVHCAGEICSSPVTINCVGGASPRIGQITVTAGGAPSCAVARQRSDPVFVYEYQPGQQCVVAVRRTANAPIRFTGLRQRKVEHAN